jgi:protein O-mannosyl-transferase
MKVSRNTFLIGFFVFILGATGIVYSNFWNNGFHLDDYHTIETNLFIRTLNNIALIFTDVKTFSNIPANASWRPLVTLSSAIDYKVGGGLNVWAFHLSMFVFFWVQLIFMFFIYEKLLKKSFDAVVPTVLAALGVAWYAVHPVCAETLNYVIARSDSLSTFFMLLAFWLYMKKGAYAKYCLYLIPLALGAMAKPTALMFFPIVLVYEVLFNENKNLFNPQSYFSKNVLRVALPTGLFFVGMYALMRKMEAGTFNPGGDSLFKYVITQPFVYAHYFQQFFYPAQLSAQSDFTVFESLADPKAVLGSVFLGLLIFTIYKTQFNIKTKPIAFGLSFFLCALIPTTFVPLAEVTNDHRMFFPFVGFVLAFITAAYLLYERYSKNNISPKILIGVALLCLGLYGYGTYQRNKIWLDEETLWKDAIAKSPKNGLGWINYGLTFLNNRDFKGAEPYFLRALEILPQYAPVHTNLGITYQNLGQIEKAQDYFKKSIETKFRQPSTHFFFARFKYQIGEVDECIKHLYECIEEAPGDIRARELLIEVLFEKERFEEVSKMCTETLELLPDNQQAQTYQKMIVGKKTKIEALEDAVKTTNDIEVVLDLSLAYYDEGEYEKCIEACQKMLTMDANYEKAYNNMCSSYNALKQYDKAVEACTKAIAIKPDYTLAKNNLELARKRGK